MSDGGKGSAPRPFSVPHSDFAANFDRIFGKAPDEIDDAPEEDDNEDEDPVCTWCGGCGEGMYDGATCGKCHGSGVEPSDKDEEP
jgi:hypothetical protein